MTKSTNTKATKVVKSTNKNPDEKIKLKKVKKTKKKETKKKTKKKKIKVTSNIPRDDNDFEFDHHLDPRYVESDHEDEYEEGEYPERGNYEDESDNDEYDDNPWGMDKQDLNEYMESLADRLE